MILFKSPPWAFTPYESGKKKSTAAAVGAFALSSSYPVQRVGRTDRKFIANRANSAVGPVNPTLSGEFPSSFPPHRSIALYCLLVMAEGLYRIGECIYMEVYPPPMPYQVCKIEELRKNSKGSVEVAAKCFYRRKDLPSNLLVAADRHALAVEEENELDSSLPSGNNFDKLSELERHIIRHRELFLSRQIETYKIDMVRGKCTVSLLNELEDVAVYLQKEDTFFYTMVYDPNQKTLLVDKGEIRVGPDYQAEIPPYISPEEREPVLTPASQVWQPNKMPDHKVEQFLVVARSIGTFARALLDGAKKPQISLRLGAAAASRDITLFHAMDTLHTNDYDITQATSFLVPRGPVLCADELEAWTQEEAKRFEDGLQEHKDFLLIQRKYLPWKPVKSIVAYYYMWKTTDRYQIQKRHRMIEKQNDLKEVIVHLRTPSGTPAGPRDLSGKAATAGAMPTSIPDQPVPKASDGEKGCESCMATTASRWYQWGPAHEHCRLCSFCYTYWRKYGGLKVPTKWESAERRISGLALVSLGTQPRKPNKDRPTGRERPNKKSRSERQSKDIVPPTPFYMIPNGLGLYMRHKIRTTSLLNLARFPFNPLDLKGIPKPSAQTMEKFLSAKKRKRRRSSKPFSLCPVGTSSPIKVIKLRPSPTPISPSYKAKSKSPFQVPKGRITTSGTFVPPKTQPGVLVQSSSLKSQITASGIIITPSGGEAETQRDTATSRKRKLEEETLDSSHPSKIPRPASPEASASGEMFFKADSGTKLAREQLGRSTLLQAARIPFKLIKY